MKKTQPATICHHFRRPPQRVRAALAVMLSIATGGAGLQAQGPVGGTVRAGDAQISGEGTTSTQIRQFTERAVIDWRQFGVGADGRVVFIQPSSQSATLNRVTGAQVSVILGKLDANGQVLLINPNGIVFGGGAQVNVGGLIASTANIGDANFMAGRLVFDQPGRLGAGILNAGAITARDGGLVALVAPHVRNDGLLAARLGKVVLGSADTFTVDLYGDALINLALNEGNAGQLVGLDGRPVTSLLTNTGHIETAGGQTVLMTARGAKAVLDNLINMSGTIKADQAVEQNGRILLLGVGGNVDVSGTLGASGGTVQVLGDRVHLAGTAALDASGASGGGTVQVGGAFQGRGDTYRSTETIVDAGATLKANAIGAGNGGDVVVWSDGNTTFGGAVEAKGGAATGDGGRLEVSGKGTLEFLGQADASAANGTSGSLLLDPAYMTIGAAEASTITRVLRTGTTAILQADVDIDVNSAIFGGDRDQGGGLNMTAGNNIHVNDFIVTNNGAINMTATGGTVTVADGKVVFAGNAPITVNANGNLSTGPMLTSGSLSIRSVAGSVAVNAFIDDHTGPVSIKAAGNVDLNQAIVNLAGGSALTIDAGQDVNVNAQVDGRGGVAGGTVTMTAARDVNVSQAVVTNNGAVSLTATSGALTVASGTPLVSGTGAMALTARGDIATGPINAGTLAITSSAGTANINGVIDSTTGETRINAGVDVNLNQAVLNGQSGGALAVNAGRDVNVNAVVDGRGGVAGGAVALTATRNVTVRDYVVTNNGAIGLTASNGALTVSPDKGTFAGNGAIAMRASGDLTTGAVSGGSLSATSTGGTVRINGVIDGSTGRVDLSAAGDVNVNQAVLNTRTGNAFNATAGRDVNLNAIVDGRGGATGGAVSLKASRDVALNNSVVTNNGTIGVTATNGAATMAAGTALVSGNQAITIDASGDVTTRGISGGSLSATSRNGSVIVDGIIDGSTGRVDLAAGRDVAINAAVLNTRTGASFNANAGQNVNVNAQIDGTGGASGGAVNLTANQNVNVNAVVATHDAAIRLTATNGTAAFASGTGLYSGSGTIAVDALGNVSTATLSGGAMTVTSHGGDVTVGGQMAGSGGAMAINAAGAVNINNAVTNSGVTSPVTVSAGTNINVNAAVGRTAAGTPSSSVTMTAGQSVNLNQSVVAENAAVSVTATSGTVISAAGEGLFAGTGNISVTAGQTLSTGATVTTGTLTLTSTAGDVDVDSEIAGSTGAVTINAANNVNVNQGIANSRTDAPLSITAGNDINVNATLDGRDADPPTHASSRTTLVASNDINLNDDVITVDAALSATATNGAVNWASGKGLFAGTGTISVTSGETLSNGITTTTGALNLTSTNGDVNVNTAIDDTTGAVAINAGATVNINQSITNLKSGNNLTVTAGTDINVQAKVDGRSGAASGGAVTMTAGNDIGVTQAIATDNGAVSLTATNGSITVPTGAESLNNPMQWIISAGNAAVNLTSGDNFTLASPVKTTGALTIKSTTGDVTIWAPITDDTGEVKVTAGDALVVNHQIKSDSHPITLTAGAGGITINSIIDYDSTDTSAVNSKAANLTLNSVGNVSILDSRGISSSETVTIDTRGKIVTGTIGNSATTPATVRPKVVVLNADAGIDQFSTGQVGEVAATSSGGTINLTVAQPNKLRITTGTPGTLDCPTCDINLSSSAIGNELGPDVVLNAGGSVTLQPVRSTGDLTLTARSGDINFNQTLIKGQMTGTAGRDITLSELLWMGGSPSQQTIGGPLSLTAGRDIVTTASTPIHISNGQTLTMVANRNLTLFILETLGAVSLTSTTGNITLNRDIGGHINNTDPLVNCPGPACSGKPDFNPDDKGVASLTITASSATAAINMQGARAEGNVTITTPGTLTAAKQITSVSGTRTLNVPLANQSLSNVAIGTVNQVIYPAISAPAVPPGPRQPLPGAPGVASASGPGLPAFAEIPVAFADQSVGAITQPGGANGGVGLAGVVASFAGPGSTSGSGARPAAPKGSGTSQTSGSSDPTSLDTAAALRTAGESCGEEQSGDTGLDAIAPASGTAADQQKPACPPAESAGQATNSTAPATTAAPTAGPVGGGLQ